MHHIQMINCNLVQKFSTLGKKCFTSIIARKKLNSNSPIL